MFTSLLRNEGACHIIFFQTPSSPCHITQYIMKPCLGRDSSQFENWCSGVTVIEKWDLVSPRTRSAVKHRHRFSGRENSTPWSPTAGSVFGQLPTLASDILLTLLNGIVAYHILFSILHFLPMDIKVKNTGMFLYKHSPHSNGYIILHRVEQMQYDPAILLFIAYLRKTLLSTKKVRKIQMTSTEEKGNHGLFNESMLCSPECGWAY